MFPNTDAILDSNPVDIPYTLALGLKELLFLTFILFFGFCGFTLCFDKIYGSPLDDATIPNVSVYSDPSAPSTYLSVSSGMYEPLGTE